jgi:RNA polymerase sigma-70 factor (ECF subfamily)
MNEPVSASLDESDRNLVAQFLKSRCEADFRALYARHADALYRLALATTYRDVNLAQDLVQETWLRAVPRLGQFGWRCALRSWLCGILINVARESQRREHRIVPLGADAIPDEPAIDAELYSTLDIENALAQLSPGYREVLLLHDLAGLTHEEIAQALEIVPGTSRSQLNRARAALRELLDGYHTASEARPG